MEIKVKNYNKLEDIKVQRWVEFNFTINNYYGYLQGDIEIHLNLIFLVIIAGYRISITLFLLLMCLGREWHYSP